MTVGELLDRLSHAHSCYEMPFAARCDLEDLANALAPPHGLMTPGDDPIRAKHLRKVDTLTPRGEE